MVEDTKTKKKKKGEFCLNLKGFLFFFCDFLVKNVD